MTEYTAPLRDMHFLLHDMGGLAQVREMPGFEEADGDLVEAILEEASRFASNVLSPLNQSGDTEKASWNATGVKMPKGWPEAHQLFSQGGWASLSAPAEFGGQQLPQLVGALVEEIWNGANLAYTLFPMLIRCTQQVIALHGTDQQKAMFLPHLVSGKWGGTMALTEPHAGSDVGAIRTKAVRQPDGTYRLSGQKIFITYGDHDLTENIVHLVLARVVGAPEGVKGISLFIVPKILPNEDGSLGLRNDVHCISTEHKLGIHASPTCVMAFGENEGAVGYLVGEENQGIQNMFLMMNAARFAVGLEAIGISERAFQRAREYANERIQGTEIGSNSEERVPIIKHPEIRRQLMAMKTRIEAMRALSCTIAISMDIAASHGDPKIRNYHQQMVELLTPISKGWFTENAVDITSQGIQIHGGVGYIEETGAAQYYRDSRILPIYEGTTGIQANDLVWRKVLRDSGSSIKRLTDEMREVQLALEAQTNQNLVSISWSLNDSIENLLSATDFILEISPYNQKRVAATATSFLELFGLVCGGWQMARSALVASKKPKENKHDTFYTGKINSARFYADHYLSKTAHLSKLITSGSMAVLEGEDLFK